MLSLRLAVVSAILMFAIACGGDYSVIISHFTVTDAVTHADAQAGRRRPSRFRSAPNRSGIEPTCPANWTLRWARR